MRKKERERPLLLSCTLSCKKYIDSRAVSRNRGSSSKEGEQSFKVLNTRLELLILLISGVTEKFLDLDNTRAFCRPTRQFATMTTITTTNNNS